MINIATKKILDNSNEEEFESIFSDIFINKCKEYLTLIELDYIIEMFFSNEVYKLKLALEKMTEGAKSKVLECLEENCHDEIYESRYRTIKELNDLITYYIEKNEQVK